MKTCHALRAEIQAIEFRLASDFETPTEHLASLLRVAKKDLKVSADHCQSCIKRGEKAPARVRPGSNCNACANIEEGAY